MEFAHMNQRGMVEAQERNPEWAHAKVSSESLEEELIIEENSAVEVRKMTTALIKKYGSPRSCSDEYKILKFLGEGSFGKVVKCLKKRSNETVTVKICKSPNMTTYVKETLILRKLNLNNPDKFNFVRNLENFSFKSHFFMVFEMLEKSLFDYMEEYKNRPLPIKGIRYVTQQLLTAQNKLRDLRIIHGVLKPENIMLVNHKYEPFRIKIIDFDSSILLPTKVYKLKLGTVIYRAPEITLGLIYNEAVDMWSTGCIVAEMLTGEMLYPGGSPYDQIRLIDETQGPFPDCMLYSNKIAAEYFCREKGKANCQWKWRVKSPREYLWDTGKTSPDFRTYRLENLDALFEVCSHVRREYDEDDIRRKHCIDMIKKMMEISHKNRILPSDAFECDFICRGKKWSN